MSSSGRVVVLGSINVDILVTAPRLPLAGETVAGTAIARQLGGKGANQAVAAARAGADCALLAAVGQDSDGTTMLAELATSGVDAASVVVRQQATGCAVVVTSASDNQIVCIAGANATVDAALAAAVALQPGDVCLAQMETPAQATADFFDRARAMGARTVLNAAPMTAEVVTLLPLCDVLVVNEGEFAALLAPADQHAAQDGHVLQQKRLIGLNDDQALVVTLGAEGALIVHGNKISRIPGRPAEVLDTTGAGDCFCGYLAAGLARGESLEVAASEANAAASIAVRSLGAAASIPHRAAVIDALTPAAN